MVVCIFAASSSRINSEFGVAAGNLGTLLARAGIGIVYGGGGIGLMGKVADAVLANDGKVTGVIPSFMKEEGWDHHGVNDMIITKDMSERKKRMFAMSDAVVALPGGIGTIEELTEAITLKQLSLWNGPIIILNTCSYYNPLLEFIDHMVENQFMRFQHKGIWEVVNTPEEVIDVLINKNNISEEWRKTARI